MSSCLACGNQARKKFCTRRCYWDSIVKHANRGGFVKYCVCCNKQIFRRPKEGPFRWKHRRFCSHECAQKFMVGNEHGHWKGGREKGRYVRLSVGPNRRIVEHRAIAERALRRVLKANEVVHHIDCNKRNNANSNLLICNRGYHKWLHDEMGRRYAQEHFGFRPDAAAAVLASA